MSQENYGNQNLSADIKIDSPKKNTFSLLVNKYLVFIALLEVVIIFVIGYVFLIKPEIQMLGSNKESIIQKQLKLEQIKKYKGKLEELKNEKEIVASQNEDYLQKFYNILPRQQELPQLIVQVEALVESFGLTLGNIQMTAPQEDNIATSSPETSVSDDKIKEVQVSIFVLGADGSYDNVKKFLEGLESHIRLFDITSFTFDPQMTTYSIVFKTYYLSNE